MDLTGEFRIPAPRQKVWEGLNDPEVLKQCIDGVQNLDRVSENEFQASVKAKVGPVSATFKGSVTLSDINPPESYTLIGQGQGGVAGFAKGSAHVTLREDGAETVLTYTAKAEVGGKLASVGSRLVQGVAAKQAEGFFAKFAEIVAGPGAEPEVVESPAASPAAVTAPEPKPEPSPAVRPEAVAEPPPPPLQPAAPVSPANMMPPTQPAPSQHSKPETEKKGPPPPMPEAPDYPTTEPGGGNLLVILGGFLFFLLVVYLILFA